jgi:hypothetical protein
LKSIGDIVVEDAGGRGFTGAQAAPSRANWRWHIFTSSQFFDLEMHSLRIVTLPTRSTRLQMST